MIRTLILTTAASLALAGAASADDVSYEAEGEALTGYFAAAEDPRGLVLIIHDWDGMTDYERRRADMLAELGYDAFALDLFGADRPLETTDERRAAVTALNQDRARMRALILAGLETARERSEASETVVMGYCFGGSAALEAARAGEAEAVAGYVSFHGGLATPEGQSWPDDAPPVLILHGGADQNPDMAEVAAFAEEMEAGALAYDIEIYSGAPHAFTVFDSPAYRERADARSWETFQRFLDETLGGAAR